MEASAIASALEGVQYSRPMTHDLFKSFIETIGATIEKIEVVDIRDNVFYALITIVHRHRAPYHRCKAFGRHSHSAQDQVRHLRCRPCDQGCHPARSQDKCGKIMVGFEQDTEKLKEILEKMNPEDFGKFKA
jgi:hypothetical protein